MLITSFDWQFSTTLKMQIGKQMNNYFTDGVFLKAQFQNVRSVGLIK